MLDSVVSSIRYKQSELKLFCGYTSPDNSMEIHYSRNPCIVVVVGCTKMYRIKACVAYVLSFEKKNRNGKKNFDFFHRLFALFSYVRISNGDVQQRGTGIPAGCRFVVAFEVPRSIFP